MIATLGTEIFRISAGGVTHQCRAFIHQRKGLLSLKPKDFGTGDTYRLRVS